MKDVVCNMEVNMSSSFSSEYNALKYYFCSKDCKIKFDKNPKKYIKK